MEKGTCSQYFLLIICLQLEHEFLRSTCRAVIANAATACPALAVPFVEQAISRFLLLQPVIMSNSNLVKLPQSSLNVIHRSIEEFEMFWKQPFPVILIHLHQCPRSTPHYPFAQDLNKSCCRLDVLQ